jgi:hypothetical protein
MINWRSGNMDDLVEKKVARALWESRQMGDQTIAFDGSRLGATSADDFEGLACAAIRAVLDAIAEPSNAVLYEGYKADMGVEDTFDSFMSLAPGWREDIGIIYRAMIAALRKELGQ